MKIEFSSQRKELFLFLTTNMAGMTSLANQQLKLGFYSFTVRFVDVQNVKIYFVGALINIPLAYMFSFCQLWSKGNLSPCLLRTLCIHMHVNNTNFKRNISLLECYHMTCIGKLKRSVAVESHE